MPPPSAPSCVFCKIIAGDIAASQVFEDQHTVCFLDSSPLFPGHVLVCPREHYETLLDLPPALAGPIMLTVQKTARAVEIAVEAEGTFVAINNRISQTVPHLHIHVVPRKRRDGLKGFFWPRVAYRDELHREAVRALISEQMKRLSES